MPWTCKRGGATKLVMTGLRHLRRPASLSDAFADEAGSPLRPIVITGSDGSKHALGTFRDTEDGSFATSPDRVCGRAGTE
ncbi:MAG TPA: hypothetical protein VHB21_00700 [Minicystis sp.]|nr:hypothetical protein [Minicystis sp.]